jgi:hypothetical protein
VRDGLVDLPLDGAGGLDADQRTDVGGFAALIADP